LSYDAFIYIHMMIEAETVMTLVLSSLTLSLSPTTLKSSSESWHTLLCHLDRTARD